MKSIDLPGRALEYLLKDKMLHMDMIEDIREAKLTSWQSGRTAC